MPQLIRESERARLEEALRPLLESVRRSASSLQLGSLPDVNALPLPLSSLEDAGAEDAYVPDFSFRPYSEWLRERTSSELCEFLIRECEAQNGRWNAFSTVYAREAMEQARRADMARSTGRPWGPLHGVPVAIKDNIAVRGWKWTGSSRVLENQVAEEDATVIARLRFSGAVMFGQTIMHELAFGMTSINPHHGAVRNPWDPERICGGSSGGSAAAVAAGLVPLALGSDTGGSIRCPAALCGVAGFKPSFGAVSRHGVLPLGGSLDTVGPIARTVAQCLAAHQVLAGEDPRDPATLGTSRFGKRPAPTSLEGLRIGLPRPYFAGAIESSIRKQITLAIERLQKAGARVENIDFPDLDAINAAALVLLLVEASAFFSPYLERGDEIGADVRGRFEQGLLIPAVDFMNTERLRAVWKREVAAILQECDVLLTPASPVTAPKIDDPYTELDGVRVDARTAISRYLRSFNFLGLPALVLPCGLDDARMPVGVQMVGPGFSDEWLLRTGMLVEEAFAFDAKPSA